MELLLTARQPFSLSVVINSHGWIRLAPFQEVEGGLSHITQLASGRVVETVIREAGDKVRLEVTQKLGRPEQEEVAANAKWMLGLEEDFSDFYSLARDEPRLAHVAERAQGRLLRSPSVFEDIVKTILTTNTAWGGTIRMVEGLVSQFGSPLPGEATHRSFPSAYNLASLGEEALRKEAGLGYRAPYVLELARAIESGTLEPESFKTEEMSTKELRRELLAIKGVGEYAAASLLMLLGRYEFVPVDTWTRKFVGQEWYGGELIGQKEVEAVFAQWGDWKGLAYWFWDWQEEDDAT
jgi:3-methyladenine DNA glycosylase/8-oxoguanine DNA glycosylase